MKSRRNANNAWQRTVTLDFNAGGTDLTFVEPSGLDPAIFNTGLEQFLPKQAPPQYTPMSTSGFGTTVNPTWLNTILSVGWNGFKGYGQGQLNIYNCATDMVIGTVNFAVLGTYNGTSWVVNQFGGDNPYIWIPSPDWSRNLLYQESGDPGAWNDMHGWSKFSGNIGLTAASMGIGLNGTALGETAVSQLPRAARDGVVKTWSSLVKRNPTVPHTPSPRAVAEPGINLTKKQLKSISSYEELIAEHKAKLAEYIKDPMKYDNQGLLKNAPNDAIREKIIRARIKVLENEIEKFESNIQKIISGVLPS